MIAIALLFACGGADPTPATPAPTPAPVSEELPEETPTLPLTAPQGPPMLIIPGNYFAEELKLGAGEEVQVLCGKRLVTGQVDVIPIGEGRVTLSVAACPSWEVLFRGFSDRMGSGSIKVGVGKGPFAPGKDRTYDMGMYRGVLRVEAADQHNYRTLMVPDEGEPYELLSVSDVEIPVGGMLWVGDLDDDNVPDFVINTPVDHEHGVMRLFLSAKSATRMPEQVGTFAYTM